MACMLKAVLIAFAAFGAAERLSAIHEAALDEHASSDVSAEQTKIRSSEATVRNAFQEFWECHSVAWTFRSTDGTYEECKRQYREAQNATGVLLQQFTAKYYWTYHGNDSAFRDGTFEEPAEVEQVVEYVGNDMSCLVVRVAPWWYDDKKLCKPPEWSVGVHGNRSTCRSK
ncbi:hypothetical protein MTO96_042105 [Rhipicephalus appendiculatus]